MNLKDAVNRFDDWSMPWTFEKCVRTSIGPENEESKYFDALVEEASRSEHWRAADLPFACKIARDETKRKFPNADDQVLASIVRAVSYNWR
jgi:hypothetical protein